jgi:hypothetical protein
MLAAAPADADLVVADPSPPPLPLTPSARRSLLRYVFRIARIRPLHNHGSFRTPYLGTIIPFPTRSVGSYSSSLRTQSPALAIVGCHLSPSSPSLRTFLPVERPSIVPWWCLKSERIWSVGTRRTSYPRADRFEKSRRAPSGGER